MRVCMFVLNTCKYDTRVLKEARTLTDAGHDVRIIAVLDEETEPYEEKDGFRIIRLDVLLPGERRAAVGGRPASQPARTATTSARKLAHSLFGRPLGFLYDWARNRPSGPLRTLLVAVYRPYSFFQYSRRAWQTVKDEPADVYHCHDLTTLPAGYLAKRRTGGKLVYDSHELFTALHYVPRAERPILRLLERSLIRRADAVITVNEFIASELSKRYGISLPDVVRNCPPMATQGDEQCSSSLRASLGLDDAVPIIVHVGMPSRARGSEKLISAVPFLNQGLIVFLGWGSEERSLRELVRQSGLEDRVLFAPPVAPDEVVAHISSAQVGVIPFLNVSLNHYYVTPNKLWECMSAGLPVVSSNFPALRAIVEGYRLGCTCDPEYPSDIANAINYVLADKDRYEEMKRNALEAAKIFNWENESAKLLEIYRRLSHRPDEGVTLRRTA